MEIFCEFSRGKENECSKRAYALLLLDYPTERNSASELARTWGLYLARTWGFYLARTWVFYFPDSQSTSSQSRTYNSGEILVVNAVNARGLLFTIPHTLAV